MNILKWWKPWEILLIVCKFEVNMVKLFVIKLPKILAESINIFQKKYCSFSLCNLVVYFSVLSVSLNGVLILIILCLKKKHFNEWRYFFNDVFTSAVSFSIRQTLLNIDWEELKRINEDFKYKKIGCISSQQTDRRKNQSQFVSITFERNTSNMFLGHWTYIHFVNI